MYTNYLPLSIFGAGILTVLIIVLGCVCKSKECNIPCPRVFRARFPIRTGTTSNLQMHRNFLINRTLAGTLQLEGVMVLCSVVSSVTRACLEQISSTTYLINPVEESGQVRTEAAVKGSREGKNSAMPVPFDSHRA